MTLTTYNQIIKAFEDFCTNHKQINTFYSGKTWNFQTETNIYPALVMLAQPSLINRGQINLNFNVFIADILNKDRSNLDEIYSDTLLIITDLISYFADAYETYGFYLDDTAVNIEPFEESFDDVLAGWISTLTIQIRYDGSTCNLPIS